MKQNRASLFAGLAIAAVFLAGCGSGGADPAGKAPADGTETVKENKTDDAQAVNGTETENSGKFSAEDENTLQVAAFESGYDVDMWREVADAFEAAHPGVTVELTIDGQLEDVIVQAMDQGNYPDVALLSTGKEQSLPEAMAQKKELLALDDVFEQKAPGEEKTVRDKLIPGFLETLSGASSDNATYFAPMFYRPYGLFYNAGLFKQKGWDVPATWDEMWELGEKAKAEGIALFTYPTAEYFDTFLYALLYSAGGSELYNGCMSYEDGIWESEGAKKVFDIVGRLAGYTEGSTVANANSEHFTDNQQLILNNKALFCPNGTWMPGEMAQAPKAEGFEWGFTAVPAVNADGTGVSYVSCEQMWIPASAKRLDLAKEFVAYLYTDEAAAIFAKKGAVLPVKDLGGVLEGDNQMFYGIFDNGASAAVGGLSLKPSEGVLEAALFGMVDGVMSGEKTTAEWQAAVEAASDQARGLLATE